ncbi:hypothetical protein BU23DRAFT_552424 [Bimuria novae-zelandiae CBS 107.79]|uniref:Uncharacterized protein n=1 Tax=Bimuria novae-zelandiae CBS 107.79 TaxID=1447943 RepID=A0A6A5VE74_9PLEO|nr:hypothetical protein BU23DRAFT_552424 [Bimuria novae-zelandiae CBS 107.79]
MVQTKFLLLALCALVYGADPVPSAVSADTSLSTDVAPLTTVTAPPSSDPAPTNASSSDPKPSDTATANATSSTGPKTTANSTSSPVPSGGAGPINVAQLGAVVGVALPVVFGML